MNISDFTFDFTFNPKEPGKEDLEGLPGNYDEKEPGGVDFRKTCRDIVTFHFIEARNSMELFFENKKIVSIDFHIDLTPDYSLLASVWLSKLRPFRSVEATPVFHIKRSLLEEYLYSHWDKDYVIPLVESLTLHHELFHVLDKYREEFFGLDEGKSRGKSVLLHLIRFRSEGIAELLYTLHSETEIHDIDSARKMFETELYRIFEISWKHPGDYNKLASGLPETYAFYSIGTWMILHVLSCPGNPKGYEMISVVLENLKCGKKTNDDIFFSLIRSALEISNFTFLKYLTEPGSDGQPFIDKKDLSLLVNVTGQIGIKRDKKEVCKNRESMFTDYYVNKVIKLYNRWGRINKPAKRKIIK